MNFLADESVDRPIVDRLRWTAIPLVMSPSSPPVLTTILVLEHDPTAVNVAVTSDRLLVDLADGRSLAVPLAWYPRLLHGTDAERGNWQLLGDGYAIEWPDLDEHIGMEGILAGRRGGESLTSLNRWLVSRSK